MAESKKTIKKEEKALSEVQAKPGEKTEGTAVIEPLESKEGGGLLGAPSVTELEKKIADLEKLVLATADKGRLVNYETSKRGDDKSINVSISRHEGGYIIGWRTVKDNLVFHPTTGATIGEEQEYELTLLRENGQTAKATVDTYKQFSDARYADRVECQVVGKTTDYQGNTTFKVKLPDGRNIELGSQFVN